MIAEMWAWGGSVADIGSATQVGSLLSGLVGTILALLAFASTRSTDRRKASKDELTATWGMQQDLNKTLNAEIDRLRGRVTVLETQLDRAHDDCEAELETMRALLRQYTGEPHEH